MFPHPKHLPRSELLLLNAVMRRRVLLLGKAQASLHRGETQWSAVR